MTGAGLSDGLVSFTDHGVFQPSTPPRRLQSEGGSRIFFGRNMAVTLWKYRRFIFANALNDLRHRFSGSVGGYLWNVFVPLAQLAVFAVIFGVLMGNRMPEGEGPPGQFNFIIFLCSGLLAWNAFADTLSRAAAGLVANAGYLKKLPLPEQIFIAQETCGGFLTATISISIFVLFSALIAHYGPRWQWLQAAPLLVLFMAFAYGLGLILACVNVFFRDVQPLIGVVILLWMWLTPVVYTENTFRNTHQEWVLTLFKFNPAYYFIGAFHDSLWQSKWLPPTRWAVCAGITLGVNAAAALVLRHFRSEIRDVL